MAEKNRAVKARTSLSFPNNLTNLTACFKRSDGLTAKVRIKRRHPEVS